MKKTTATLAAAAAALAMTACVPTTGGTVSDDAPSGSNRPSTSSSTSSEAYEEDALSGQAPEPEDTATEDAGNGILSFGETITYEDNISVTVSDPTQVTPSESAYPSAASATQFTITIVNGSSTPLDPSLAYPNVQSANVEAEEIFDIDSGYGGPPSTSVLPGREVTYKAAFATTDSSDLVFQFAPTWDHEDTFWTNSN